MKRDYPLANYHTHCQWDDGRDHPETYVKTAIAEGFRYLGFSCHTPCGVEDEWHLPDSRYPQYLSELNTLKRRYQNEITLFRGLELDYREGDGALLGKEYIPDLDYTIASVHMMEMPDGRYLSFDGPVEEFESLLKGKFGGNIRKMVGLYFEMERELIEKHDFSILGHPDLIKKKNRGSRYFNQEESWYKELAQSMLRAAAAKGVRLEVNTGGLSRGATTELYPSPWMLQQCADLNIPLVLASDAHRPDHLGYYFREARELLRKTGYQTLDILTEEGWQHRCI